MRNTSITANGMLAATPTENRPSWGCHFSHSCCSNPIAIAPANVSGRLRHPSDHDGRERPDEQERELELREPDDG